LIEIHKLLKGKKTKLVLYTYDSFLFDYDASEDLKDDIENIFQKKKLQIKVKNGTSYDFE
jgi:ABC-type thiamine transport system substrate-binding protein